jgi:hypothetical protein
MKGHFAATLCLVLLAWASPAAPTQLHTWKEYVYTSDGFAVSAPTPPKVESRTANSPGGEVEVHSYSFSLGRDSGFMVMTNDLNPTDRRTPQQILTDGKHGAVAAVNGKLVSEMPKTLGKYPGIQLEIDASRYRIQSQQYVVGRKLYQLLIAAPMGQPMPPESDRLFQSFRLVSSPR